MPPVMRTLRLVLAASALGVAAAPLAAQAPAVVPAGPRLALLAGLSSATLGGDDAGNTDRRNGFFAGVSLAVPISPALAFRPELLYVQKGARTTFSEDGFEASGGVDLAYLEVPLLLEATVPAAGRVRPRFYAGPAIGVRVACDVSFRVEGEGGSASCDRLDELTGEEQAEVKRLDVSGVAGGEVAFGAGAGAFAVGARYTHGFADVVEDGAAKNRALLLYGALEFPVARRPR